MYAVVEERWREERRGRILGAAGRIFASRGFRGASMDEIAEAAAVGKPTLYRYYPSKDALFAAAFGEALDALEARLQRALDPELGIQKQIAVLVRELLPMVRHHMVPLPIADAATADRSRRRIVRERRARIEACFAAALAAGMRRGEVRALDPERVAGLVLGMVWSAAATGGDTAEAAGTDIATLIVNGLAPRRGRPRPPWV
ncbi:MAG: TetR/AcrR family transcriptional regulator, partial [Enterovirga sp.]|nr:TetR/AcrR family transcriptional regulator [Enterovirga sp.]